ncbi:MAG: hypothetical protein ACT4OK_03740 [Gemmobacter sp.]
MRIGPAFLIGGLLLAAAAPAADLDGAPADAEGPAIIALSGEITRGDADRMAALLTRFPDAFVFLDSEGGLVAEALRMGNMVRESAVATAVNAGDECRSACALIWVAGRQRYLSAEGRVGAHAAYIDRGSSVETSGIGNAEIGAYLARLGLSDAAVRFFTVASPDRMLDLTPDLARIVGIDMTILDDQDTAATDQVAPPAADDALVRDAVQFASYAVLGESCAVFLTPDPSVVEGGLGRIDPARFEDPAFEASIDTAGDVLAENVGEKGLLHACLDIEADLRRNGLPTGIDGPSFGCNQAGTPTETALCTTPDLWPMDRAMNALYFHVRGLSDPTARKRILAEQRAWMTARNACGADDDCLKQRYEARLRDFRDVVPER